MSAMDSMNLSNIACLNIYCHNTTQITNLKSFVLIIYHKNGE